LYLDDLNALLDISKQNLKIFKMLTFQTLFIIPLTLTDKSNNDLIDINIRINEIHVDIRPLLIKEFKLLHEAIQMKQ
jgi:hypothetical protein